MTTAAADHRGKEVYRSFARKSPPNLRGIKHNEIKNSSLITRGVQNNVSHAGREDGFGTQTSGIARPMFTSRRTLSARQSECDAFVAIIEAGMPQKQDYLQRNFC